MKNFILKRKMILLIILFLFISSFISFDKCFAASNQYNCGYCGSNYQYICDFPDEFSSYPDISNGNAHLYGTMLLRDKNTDTYYFFDFMSSYLYNRHNGYFYLKDNIITYSNNSNISIDCYYFNGTNWIKDKSFRPDVSIYNIVSSGVDIYKTSGKEELFFPVAPPEEEIPEEIPQEMATLPEIMEQVEMKATLKEIVALLPVILSVLVSLLALRKALQMLLNFLRVS